MLWRKGIIIKLQNMGICGRIIKWIDNFLTNRKIQVKINNTFSTFCTVQNGVPQGTVISPLLFNIAVNDLPDNITGIQISQYADVQFLQIKIQNALNNVENWCKQWGLKLSASKTSAVLFTRKTDTNLNIYINKTKINLCKFAKFLGITFDQELNWTQHINNVIDRCKKRLNILRCISGCDWGTDGKTLLHLYKALIRSILEYGCEAFDSASNTIKQKLDSIQYQALKICTGAIHGTALSFLQIECGEPSLQLRRNFNNNTYGTKIELHKSHPNTKFKTR